MDLIDYENMMIVLENIFNLMVIYQVYHVNHGP